MEINTTVKCEMLSEHYRISLNGKSIEVHISSSGLMTILPNPSERMMVKGIASEGFVFKCSKPGMVGDIAQMLLACVDLANKKAT